MIASIRSSAASSSHEPSPARTARIAELNKRVGSLQQELKVAQDIKPAELAGLRTNSISQDIVVATSQIEKIVLEAQLAKLSLNTEREASKVNEASSSDTESGGQADTQDETRRAVEAGAAGAADNSGKAGNGVGPPALPEDAERLTAQQRAAVHALRAGHRQGVGAAPGTISNTYRSDSEKVQRLNLQA